MLIYCRDRCVRERERSLYVSITTFRLFIILLYLFIMFLRASLWYIYKLHVYNVFNIMHDIPTVSLFVSSHFRLYVWEIMTSTLKKMSKHTNKVIVFVKVFMVWGWYKRSSGLHTTCFVLWSSSLIGVKWWIDLLNWRQAFLYQQITSRLWPIKLSPRDYQYILDAPLSIPFAVVANISFAVTYNNLFNGRSKSVFSTSINY